MAALSSWLSSAFSGLLWQHHPEPQDLRRSRKLLEPLAISPATKAYVVALPLPDRPAAIVYLLSAHYLSERSASDAASLVRCVSPRSVLAQVDPEDLALLETELQISQNPALVSVPTSPVDVVRRCFMEGRIPSSFESSAGFHVLRVLFGTNYFGHVLAAKEAAEETGSYFSYIIAPRRFNLDADQDTDTARVSSEASAFVHVRKNVSDSSEIDGSCDGGSNSSKKRAEMHRSSISLIKAEHLESMKSLAPLIASEMRKKFSTDQDQSSQQVASTSEMDFNCPPYALPFYSLLPVLQESLEALPGYGSLLSSAQNVLLDVQQGKVIDEQTLAQAKMFRVGMEAIRWELNARARKTIALPVSSDASATFNQLSYEDKCHVILAKALQSQARNGQTVVAILEAGSIEGVRKHWSTPVSEELAALSKECFISLEDEDEEIGGEDMENSNGGGLERPVMVVGAGAAAAMGWVSLSKIFHASPLFKIVTFKIPNIVKIGFLKAQSTAAYSMPKMLASAFKTIAPAVKTTSPFKFFSISGSKASVATANAERARSAASTITFAAKRASISAIRTAFYSIMRNRQGKPIRGSPWLLLGGSIVTGGAVIFASDRLEAAIEALPTAPSVAQLGRGLQNLQTAADVLLQMEHSQTLNKVYDSLFSFTAKRP